MAVLGIDPSTQIIGWACVDGSQFDAGVIDLRRATDGGTLEQRRRALRIAVPELLEYLSGQGYGLRAVGIEQPPFMKQIQTYAKLIQFKTVIEESLCHHGITTVVDVAPAQWQKLVTGGKRLRRAEIKAAARDGAPFLCAGGRADQDIFDAYWVARWTADNGET